MDNINIEEVVNQIIGGMSLREAGKQYQIDREALKDRCMEYFKINPARLSEFEAAVKKNKANSTEVVISDEVLENTCLDLCYRRNNLRAIAARIHVDEGTLREKLFQYLSRPENTELARKYISYQADIHPDYSHINFKALIVEMIKQDMSQSQIALEYGIPPRTIGREIEKLKQEEGYQKLYEICKEYSYRKMQRKSFSQLEQLLLRDVVDKYRDEGPIIVEGGKDKRRIQYDKARKNVEEADKIEGTEAEKAKALGIGISTLRRNRIFVEKYEKEQELSEKKQK